MRLIMTAAYPEDVLDAHQLWSRILFSAFAGVMSVSAFAFRREEPSRLIIAAAALGHLTTACRDPRGRPAAMRGRPIRPTPLESPALGRWGGQALSVGVPHGFEVGEAVAGRKPRAIIQTPSTISWMARGVYSRVCCVESVSMTEYIASRKAAT